MFILLTYYSVHSVFVLIISCLFAIIYDTFSCLCRLWQLSSCFGSPEDLDDQMAVPIARVLRLHSEPRKRSLLEPEQCFATLNAVFDDLATSCGQPIPEPVGQAFQLWKFDYGPSTASSLVPQDSRRHFREVTIQLRCRTPACFRGYD